MTLAIARRRILTDRDVHRRESRRIGRRAARSQGGQVLHATNEVGVLFSMLAADEESDA